MRKLLACLLALVATPALALNLSNVPPKFPIPWGNSAGGAFIRSIPQASQIGIQNCAASLTDGFPPLTFQPVSGGGCAPFGSDFNGILKQLSQWSQWAGAGAFPTWDSSFSASIGGYPRGAVVANATQTGCYWTNQTDGNATNPDSGGAGWTSTCPGGGVAAAATGGSANAQTVTVTPFLTQNGATIFVFPTLANTGSMTLAVNGAPPANVLKMTPSGLASLSGGEFTGGFLQLISVSGSWQLMTSGAYPFLTVPDQLLSGGANVASLGLASGTITVDCGARPLQWVANVGSFSINAPSSDGSCMVQIENGGGAGTISAGAGQGWTIGANVGDPLDTTNGHKFVMSIWRIHNVASYTIKALQ